MRDHGRTVQAYIDGVRSGEIVAGTLVRAAVERHVRDLERAAARGYVFDPAAANAAIDFFPVLQHTTGEFDGRPFELEAWQKFLCWVLFGWRRADDGLRRFRKAFLSMGRGNGKSPLAAAVGLMLQVCDKPLEARAEVICSATRLKQARFVWDEARRFVEKIPSLRKRMQVYDSAQNARLVFTPNESVFYPMEFSPTGLDGQVLHAAIVDELHAWRAQHRVMLDNIETAMAKRRQPLTIYITTAGSEESVLWQDEYKLACAVAQGVVRADHYFALIYQLDEGDDIHDPAHWPKANPNLGVSVKLDGLQGLSDEAKSNPAKRAKFRRYHCNLKTSSSTKAVTAELWAKGDGPLPDLAGRPCHGGIDLGWRDDLAAFFLVFPLEERRFAVTGWCWIPRECGRDLAEEPWAGWIRDGLLRVTDGNTTDHEAIYAQAAEVRRLYELRTVAIDPNNARVVGTHLENALDVRTFEFWQTCRKYNEPVREFLTALKEGRIRHGGHSLLGWAALNLMLKADAQDYLMPAKGKSADKIDPMVATLMGFSECLFGAKDGPNPYEQHGLRRL